MQDPVPATIEPWNAGVCGLNARGDPDYATTRFYAPGMALPATAPGGAFLITHTLIPPVAVAPTLAQWHHVWQLTVPAPPMEPGISLHMSQGATWGTPPTLLCQLTPSQPGHREIPRVEGTTQILENLAWSTQPPTGPPAPLDRLWYLQTSWAGIVLSGAADNAIYNSSPCPNPNFGLAAVDPDFTDQGLGTPPRFDDYVWEVRAGSLYGGGAGVLLLAMSVWPNGGVATPYGQLHIDISDPLFIGPVLMPALDGQGMSRLVFNLGPGSSGLRQVITTLPCLSAQAAVFSQGQPLRLSSLWTLRPRLLPPGFTGATATPATPFILNRPANVATTAIRNDGRGELQAQFYDRQHGDRAAAHDRRAHAGPSAVADGGDDAAGPRHADDADALRLPLKRMPARRAGSATTSGFLAGLGCSEARWRCGGSRPAKICAWREHDRRRWWHRARQPGGPMRRGVFSSVGLAL